MFRKGCQVERRRRRPMLSRVPSFWYVPGRGPSGVAVGWSPLCVQHLMSDRPSFVMRARGFLKRGSAEDTLSGAAGTANLPLLDDRQPPAVRRKGTSRNSITREHSPPSTQFAWIPAKAVGLAGFEPAASWPPAKRAAKLRHSPKTSHDIPRRYTEQAPINRKNPSNGRSPA